MGGDPIDRGQAQLYHGDLVPGVRVPWNLDESELIMDGAQVLINRAMASMASS